MKHKVYLLMATALCCLLLAGCDDDDNPNGEKNSVKQIDMTVVVPIHPSSLAYFDYAIQYQDNQGAKYNDTVRETIATEALSASKCYVKTYCYNKAPVACSVTVDMLPKCDDGIVGPCYFYPPKPYIYSNVYDDALPELGDPLNQHLENIECIRIDAMPLSKFQSTYGLTFTTHCQVKKGVDGYEGISYSF